jgi:hypothetical protein
MHFSVRKIGLLVAATAFISICSSSYAQPRLWDSLNPLNPNTGRPNGSNSNTTSTNPITYNYGRDQAKTHKLNRLRQYTTKSIKDCIPLGDGRSFIIVDPKGFTVYRRDNATIKVIGGINVDDLQKVESLGDGRTFVVTSVDEFAVYEVQETQVTQVSSR